MGTLKTPPLQDKAARPTFGGNRSDPTDIRIFRKPDVSVEEIAAFFDVSVVQVKNALSTVLDGREDIGRRELWRVLLRSVDPATPAKQPVNRRSLTRAMRERIHTRDQLRCRYCGKKTTYANRAIDHVLPVHFGGTSEEVNLVLACARCNGHKGSKLLWETSMTLLFPDYLPEDIARAQRAMAVIEMDKVT